MAVLEDRIYVSGFGGLACLYKKSGEVVWENSEKMIAIDSDDEGNVFGKQLYEGEIKTFDKYGNSIERYSFGKDGEIVKKGNGFSLWRFWKNNFLQ